MRKRLQHLPLAALFAVLLLALAPYKADAQVQIGNFSYTFSGNEATITQCHLSSGAIVFPETVQHGGKTYNVTAIQFTGYSFLSGSPTSITGNSIKRITGSVDRAIYNGNGHFCSCDNLTAISFPKLETLSMCGFLETAPKLTSVSFPLLERIDRVALLINCAMLSSVDLPKLREMYSNNSLSHLPNLATLNLPALTTIKGSYNIQNLPKLTSLQLPVLKVIDSSHTLSSIPLLSTLHLPELERATAEGFNIFSSLSALTDLKLPKLMLIEGQQFMQGSNLSVIELPYGCEINVSWGSFAVNSSTSLTIKGVTKIKDNFFTPHCYSLKHLSLPDVQEISGQIGYYITNIERVDMPNLKKINNCAFFNVDQYNQHLTTVNIPKVTDIKGSNLFEGAPIQELTLSGNITDGGSGQIHLTAYPTVVKIIDAGTVNDNSKIFQDVKGGRLIAPEGKAALYAQKWHVPMSRMMVYAPGKIAKSTVGTLYATGSISPAMTETVYGGTTYTSAYDLRNAMTKAECLNSAVLGPNDVGFTPSLSSLVVSAYSSPFTTFDAYIAKQYADDGADPQLGDLTLASLSPAAVGTVKGFGTSPATTYEGLNATTGGFLFKGNAATFDELYLPYTATVMPTPATNYLKPGEGTTVPRKTGSNFNFYWHPGDASYDMGFYMSAGVNVPEGRAYLSLPASLTGNAHAKGFRLIFDDGETTGISSPVVRHEQGEQWFTLEGIRLKAQPTRAGLYIHNGRKVLVK